MQKKICNSLTVKLNLTLWHIPPSSFTFISGFVRAFKPVPWFWSQDLFLCMNKMWRKAAGYVHPLWQELYIGHICWGNPLRSLIEAGLWIQGSHDINALEWTVTWFGRKSVAFFPDFLRTFELHLRPRVHKVIWNRHDPNLLFSYLSLYLSVSEELSG